MRKWRIKEIFSVKYDRKLYIPQLKWWVFYYSMTYHDYCECIEPRHDMSCSYELVHTAFDTLAGFHTIESAKNAIRFYEEYFRILAEHEAAEKEARKHGKMHQNKYIKVEL